MTSSHSELPTPRHQHTPAGDSAGSSDDSASYWDFGDRRDRRENPIHRIHSYPAKFPAFIATKALEYARRQGIDVKVVADVFCGCGTSAVEAKRSGRHFWGCDINPVATLIAKAKTRNYQDAVLLRYFDDIRDAFRRLSPPREDYARIGDRIRYWFPERNVDDLIRLDHAIRRRTPINSPYRTFFLCGFSNILKPTSRWLTKSIKAQLDPHKSPRRVMGAFEAQFALMRNACEQNRFPAGRHTVHIRTQNFLASSQPACRADLIVTSPPYVTSYDYADIHQLSALWLRYTSDYRALRKNMLGNQYGVEPPSLAAIELLGKTATETYRSLLREARHQAHSVARYFLDMDKVVAKCWRMLNDRGMAVFVIGNTQYKGVRIDNAGHLAYCMDRAGFRDIEAAPRKISWKIMTPYRDAAGRFTQDSTQRRVYGEEYVVVGRR